MIIGLLSTIIVVLGFAVFNLLRKLEFYETQIEDFYSKTSIVLHSMRVLDEKQMFEKDDEVGELFRQLTDILGTLRPLIYGINDEEKN
jgi:hypothetical protein